MRQTPLLGRASLLRGVRRKKSPPVLKTPGRFDAAQTSDSRVSLGINMIEIDYWTQSCPFNNLIYGESTKYTSGAFSGAITDYPSANLDADKWPNTLPNVGAYVLRILSNPVSTGIFNVTWQGNISDMFLSSGPASLTSIDYVNRTAVLTITSVLPAAVSPLILKYTFTDTVNYPKNISIVPSGSSGRFTTKFLTDLQRFRGPIRFVKWNQSVESNSGNQTAWAGGTSSSPTRLILWANRNTVTGGDWKAYDGVPIEVIVDLANTVNRDIHVNFPWNADDAYVTGVATYVRDNLNAGLVARFEVSNEVWNAGYNIYFQAGAEGTALGLPDRGHGGGRGVAASRYAMRVYEMMSLVTTVFSGQMSRCMRLLCCQHANAWESGEILGYMATNGWDSYVDGLATAPYFSTDLSTSYTGDPQAVYDDVRRYIDTFLTPDAATHKATATTYSKVYTTYECGPSLLFSNASYQRRIHTDGRMYWMLRYYLQWMEAYWSSAICFSWCHPIDAVNAWGLKEYEGQVVDLPDTPKLAAADWYVNSGNYAAAAPTGIATGVLKVWNGSAWVSGKPVKIWDGSAWTAKLLKLYTGTDWITVSTIPAATGVAFTTTNGANKSSNITLSNSNLTAIGNASNAGYQCVRADTAKTGQRQFEVTLDTLSPFGPSIYIGVDDGSLSFATDGGSQAIVPVITGSVIRISGNGTYAGYRDNTNVIGGAMSGGFANGDIISVVYDTGANTVTYYRVRSGTPVIIDSTITGVSPTTWTAFAGGDENNQYTANFGATTFARSLDVGYSAYQT